MNLKALRTNYNKQRLITSGKWKLAVYGLDDQDEEVESWKSEYIIYLGWQERFLPNTRGMQRERERERERERLVDCSV